MSLDQWSDRNELLNSFGRTIHHETNGLVRGVTLDLADDCMIVQGNARSYYGIQLAIQALKQLGSKQRLFSETQLQLQVEGNPVSFSIAHPQPEQTGEPASTPGDRGHSELTDAASRVRAS
ncbi:hypothetical protein [Thalassoglobus polymorphus]|uniref:BON domain protein n=1 Tax=Thalassoglobus polymorphus TaxID=2527994 RepID=A0A517QT53_9PLAN|nr:hypothetical protein [Thalassoglobus polymorphus]QDT34772.1 hypothetical protein Mal48_40440 [Thalassoglobus polymorphus]